MAINYGKGKNDSDYDLNKWVISVSSVSATGERSEACLLVRQR